MRRLFAAIFILGTLLGATRFAAMEPMAMSHHDMGDMSCQGRACAARPEWPSPVQDCIDYCLSAAFDAAPSTTPVTFILLALTLILITGSRTLARPFLAHGAAPYLASLLRLHSLSTVVMRN